MRFICLALTGWLSIESASAAEEAPVVPPSSGESRMIRLFDGASLSGWRGDDRSWAVQSGVLVGRGSNPQSKRSFLLTEGDFTEFRLTLEFRWVGAPSSTGIAFWGQTLAGASDEFGYAGHFLSFPPQAAITDLHGRGLLVKLNDGPGAELLPDTWHRVELLAQGNRIRLVIDGRLAADWREPIPDRIQAAPIGLAVPAGPGQPEVHFRRLMIETFPEVELVTLADRVSAAGQNRTELSVTLSDDTETWTRYRDAAVPDSLFASVHPNRPFRPAGLSADEAPAFYAMLHKAAQTNEAVVRQSAAEFLQKRLKAGLEGRFSSRSASLFPVFYDITSEPDVWQGKTVTLKGHVRKLVRVPAGDNAYGISEYWEAWLYTEHARRNPFLIVSLERDERMEPGAEVLIDNVSASGWFFKLYGYQAQEGGWVAPMVITRRLDYRPVSQPRGILEGGIDPRLLAIVLTLAALGCWYAFRLWARLRIEDRQRSQLRSLVDQHAPVPEFDHVTDNQGIQFPSGADSPAELPSTGPDRANDEQRPDHENEATSRDD